MLDSIALVLLAALAGAPAGRSPGEAPPAGLGGPEVDRTPTARTIVERAADGSLVDLDRVPIEAAIAKLELDAPTRERVDALILERQCALDKAVQENIGLLTQLHSARAAGRTQEAKELLEEFLSRAPELKDWAGHRHRLLDELPEAQRAEAVRMLDEWRQATLEDLRNQSDRTGEPIARLAGANAIRLFGGEVRRAYERITSFGQDRLEATLAAVEATPEQERAIRAIVTEWAQKTGLNPTDADRRELFIRVARELTEDQVRKLAEFTRGVPAGPPS